MNSENMFSRPSSNIQKKYNKIEESFEYHLGINLDITPEIPYVDISIPIDRIQYMFSILRKKYGEIETIREYSIYKNNDLELTVFPDGSSFCRKIIVKEIKNIDIPSVNFICYKEKFKIPNDYFPCKYVYNSIIDIVDVVFTIYDGIKVVLSTMYENNRNFEKVKKVEDLGRPYSIQKSKKSWCEAYLIVDVSSNSEDNSENIINTIKMLTEI